MTPNDLNTLKWYSSITERNRSQERATGPKFNLIASVYRFPPFDFTFDPTGGSITYLRLTKLEDGSVHDILQALVTTGLTDHQESNQGNPFDAYRYPSSTNAPLGVEPGVYYAEMRDNAGGNWWSDDILFVADTDKMVVLEWWHMEKLFYADRFVKYDYPYKGRCVFPTHPGKPLYQIEKQVTTRDGKIFPSQTVSYKEHRFWFAAPEHLLDSLRCVDQHDCKQIKFRGKTYDVDEIRFNPEWIEDGNLAWVECIFTTDTVVVVNGRALIGKSYDADDGTCLVAQFTALTEMNEGNPNFINRIYNGQPMEDGMLFVIIGMSLDEKVLKAYDEAGDTFDPVAIAQNDVVYVRDIDTYYLQKTYLQGPEITEILDTPDRVKGVVWANTTVEVWLKDDFGNEWLASVGTGSDFNGGGIEFTKGDATHVQARVNSIRCNQFAKTAWVPFDLDGIGYMIIEGGPPTNRVG